MPNDKSVIKFYRIVCKDLGITDCYVGSTTNFTKRKALHKYSCNHETSTSHNYKVYRTIRENRGWNNWQMVLIEKGQYEDKLDARLHERELMERFKATLNSIDPAQTPAERAQFYVDYNIKHHERITIHKNIKHDCGCGGKYTNTGKSQHLKTKKHQRYVSGTTTSSQPQNILEEGKSMNMNECGSV